MIGIESAFPRFPPEKAEQFICKASFLFSKTKIRKINVSKKELKTMSELKWVESVKILTVDKANATVILGVKTYERKCLILLMLVNIFF